jgi:hypothetical protein
MTGKTDWKVIVLSHHPLHWYGHMPNVLTILNGYIGGTSGSIMADGASISFDFSGKNAAKFVGTFHGHTHNLIYGKVGDNNIIRFGTPNGCNGRENEYGSTSYGDEFRKKYGEVEEAEDGTLTRVLWSKTANSGKDTAFVVYTIDFDKEVIYATCYGAGYDRVLAYKDVTFYSIEKVLTGVSIDNNSAAIEEGSSYTATLTVADTYTLKSVVVTMGGVDITSAAYADGVITIAEVTGNIVITATATAPVVNLVKTSTELTSDAIYNGGLGYKNGVYLSSSGGGDSTDDNCVATGCIAIDGSSADKLPTIYVKSITADTSSHSRLVTFKSDKSYQNMVGGGGVFSSTYFTVTQLGEQYYKCEPIVSQWSQYITNNGAFSYIRISIDNNVGDNLFIATEPIN